MYYINPIELTGAVKNVDVLNLEQTLTPEELTGLLKQAMQDAIAPLHSEVAALKTELEATQTKLRDELLEQAEEYDRKIVEQLSLMLDEKLKKFIREALQAQTIS